MNKFEKLIEYIINDEDQKARELFHTIVVEKSRDIYESIMDEESMEETVHGQPVENMVDEISQEEAVGEDDEAGEEFSFDQEGEDSGEEAGEEEAGEEFGAEESEDDKIMNIDAKLDELLAKFDEIMGDDNAEQMPAEEPAMDDMGAEQEVGAEEEPTMFEGENPFAKGSGKSGSATSGKSGKSGSAMSGKSGKAGSGKTEGKQSSSELMREYVDRIGDIYGGAGDAAEGDAVGGAGKKTSVNAKSITGPGADFGGKTASSKGGEQNQDGNSAPASEKPAEIKSGNINVPGGKAGNAFKTKESAKDSEGSTTDGSVPVSDKSVVKQNSGK